MPTKYAQGIFTPRNPDKYIGVGDIKYRSSWEHAFMRFLDNNPSVMRWASESIRIPYFNPFVNKQTTYVPDFLIVYKDKFGKEHGEVIEIKPEKQTKKPIQKRQTRRFLEEAATYAINQEKWRAADIFCQKEGWDFMVLTEKDLGI